MGDQERPILANFVRYCPRLQELDLKEDELRSIPVHAEPPSDTEFLSLGELPPGAPPLDEGRFRFVGSRQIYVYRSEIPPPLWHKLVARLGRAAPSGTGAPRLFGNPEEKVVDSEDPVQSWRVLDAGEPYAPLERLSWRGACTAAPIRS